MVEEILCNAASVGGRAASTGLNSAAQVQTAVTNYLALAGLPTQNVTVTVSDLTNPGTDPTAATALDQIQVSVSIPFSNVTLVGDQHVPAGQHAAERHGDMVLGQPVLVSDEYYSPRRELTDGPGRNATRRSTRAGGSGRRGAAVVEAAIVLPVCFLLLLEHFRFRPPDHDGAVAGQRGASGARLAVTNTGTLATADIQNNVTQCLAGQSLAQHDRFRSTK